MINKDMSEIVNTMMILMKRLISLSRASATLCQLLIIVQMMYCYCLDPLLNESKLFLAAVGELIDTANN